MSGLLSQEKLEQLPLRAIVAFAARCARRVLPIYQIRYIGAKSSTDVERAIQISERFAAGDEVTQDSLDAAEAAYAALTAAAIDAYAAAIAAAAAHAA